MVEEGIQQQQRSWMDRVDSDLPDERFSSGRFHHVQAGVVRTNQCVGVGRGRGKCFGCGEEGHYVAQCLKKSPRKCFFSCHYGVEKVKVVSIAQSWVTRQYHAQNLDS